MSREKKPIRLPISMTEKQHAMLSIIAKASNKSMSTVLTEYIDMLQLFGGVPDIIICSNGNNDLGTELYLKGEHQQFVSSISFSHEAGKLPVYKIAKVKTKDNHPVIDKNMLVEIEVISSLEEKEGVECSCQDGESK
jgi:hypothetical protein